MKLLRFFYLTCAMFFLNSPLFAAKIIIQNNTDATIIANGMLFSQDPQTPPAKSNTLIDKNNIGILILDVAFPARLVLLASDGLGNQCSLINYNYMAVIKINDQLICHP